MNDKSSTKNIDYSNICKKIDQTLFCVEIERHIKKKNEQYHKGLKSISKKQQSKNYPGIIRKKEGKNAKVETITIPSTAKKLIITLET